MHGSPASTPPKLSFCQKNMDVAGDEVPSMEPAFQYPTYFAFQRIVNSYVRLICLDLGGARDVLIVPSLGNGGHDRRGAEHDQRDDRQADH